MTVYWQMQEAKNRLSEVVERACTAGPQIITVRGQVRAVILSAEEYARLTQPRESLSEFFQRSPLVGLDLEHQPRSDVGRRVDVE
jgi:prevent-host-death family protein